MTGRQELATVTGVMLALALVSTYPLAPMATVALPNDLGDPLLNTFILAWDADRILHGFRAFWDAPFYFPLTNTLALSEHLTGVAIFTAPVQWLTGNPVLAYNLAHLASMVLAGVGMYLLARVLFGRPDAAWVAAVAFAMAPHRLMHVAHLQVLMSGWMPVSLWGLHRYLETGSRRALAVCAAAYALLALSNGYFLYFFALPCASVIVFDLARRVRRRQPAARVLRDLCVAGIAVLAAISPAALAYLKIRSTGARRDIGEIAAFSASAQDFLRRPTELPVWSAWLRVGEPERMLFPGLLVVMLAAASLCAWWTEEPRAGDAAGAPGPRRHVVTYLAILAAAVWMSFGPAVPGPYRLLLPVLPGFDGLRVPARFIVIVALALAVLAAAGTAWLCARMTPRAARWTTALLAVVLCAEGYGGPLYMEHFSPWQRSRSTLNTWLMSGPGGGLVELPIGGPDLRPYTLGYQYNTLLHGRPVVNGYSGYGYPLQDYLGGPASPLANMEELPHVLRGLRQLGVRYVTMHQSAGREHAEPGWPDPEALAEAIDREQQQIERVFTGAQARGWQLGPSPITPAFDQRAWATIDASRMTVSASVLPERARAIVDGRLETRWHSNAPQAGGEWLRIEFDRPRDVAAIRIDATRERTGDYPRWLLVESESDDGLRRELFSDSVVPQLMAGMVRDGSRSPIVIRLPGNRSRALTLRQLGRARTWQWSVSELVLWERAPAPR
jgi:hypothetical protein